jgi:hypothetical protein
MREAFDCGNWKNMASGYCSFTYHCRTAAGWYGDLRDGRYGRQCQSATSGSIKTPNSVSSKPAAAQSGYGAFQVKGQCPKAAPNSPFGILPGWAKCGRRNGRLHTEDAEPKCPTIRGTSLRRRCEYIPTLLHGTCLSLWFGTSHTRGGVRCPPGQSELEIDMRDELSNSQPLAIARRLLSSYGLTIPDN